MIFIDHLSDYVKIASIYSYLKRNDLHFEQCDFNKHYQYVTNVLGTSIPSLIDYFRVERPKTFDKIERLNEQIIDFLPDIEYLFSVVTVSNFAILIDQQNLDIKSSKIIDTHSIALNAINTAIDLFDHALTMDLNQLKPLSVRDYCDLMTQVSKPFFTNSILDYPTLTNNLKKIKSIGTWLLIYALQLKPKS